MALTITETERIPLAEGEWLYFLTVAFDASYPTGGEAFGIDKNERFRAVWCVGDGEGYTFDWDVETQKLLVYYVDNNAAGDSAQIQVPDTTDISALDSVKLLAIGY